MIGRIRGDKRDLVSIGVIVIVTWLMSVVVHTIYENGTVANISISYSIKSLVYMLLFVIAIAMIHRFRSIKLPDIFELKARNIIGISVVLLIPWLLILFIFYPGVCNFDTCNQLIDLYTGTAPMPFEWIDGQETVSVLLNDHHPVVDTFIFSFFIEIGVFVLRSARFGVFLYCLVQLMVYAVSWAYMLCRIRKWGASVVVSWVSLGLLLFNPYFPMFAICMLKDSLHALVFIWYFLNYSGCLLESPNKKRVMLICVLSIILALTRKTGIYLALISNLGLLLSIKCRKYWHWLLAGAIIPYLVVGIIMPKVIFPLVNIYPGGKQEMLAVPFQQVAKTYIDYPGEFEEKDRDLLSRLIDVDNLESIYNDHSADDVKNTFNMHAAKEDLSSFAAMWIREGIRHPLLYIVTDIKLVAPYVTFGQVTDFYTEFHPISLGNNPISHPKALLKVQEKYLEMIRKIWTIQGIKIIFQLALYVLWLPITSVWFILKKQKCEHLYMFIPIVVLDLFLIAGPVYASRYALPIVVVFPMFLGTINGFECNE